MAIELSCSAKKCCPCMVHISTATLGTDGCDRSPSDFNDTSGMTRRNSSQGASSDSTADRRWRLPLGLAVSVAFSVVKAMSHEILGQEAMAAAGSGYKILVRRSIAAQHGIVGELSRVCGVELHPGVH